MLVGKHGQRERASHVALVVRLVAAQVTWWQSLIVQLRYSSTAGLVCFWHRKVRVRKAAHTILQQSMGTADTAAPTSGRPSPPAVTDKNAKPAVTPHP